METEIPIWKQMDYDNYPYGKGYFGHPRFNIGKVQSLTRSRIISVTSWGLTKKKTNGNGFRTGIPIAISRYPYANGQVEKKIPFGESQLPNTIRDHWASVSGYGATVSVREASRSACGASRSACEPPIGHKS